MKYRVVLVSAPSLGVIEPAYDAPEFPRGALACLAAYLREHGYKDVLCIDAKFDKLSFDETLERILKYNADIVGFTAFTNEIKPCAYIANKLKKMQPNLYTVIGGAHLSALPIPTLKEFDGFDFGVVGDGEETLLELILALESNSNPNNIKGLVYKSNSEIVQNPARDRLLDLDELPIPAWDLFRPAKQYWVQTIKGCPFKCNFCMNHNGRVARKRSVQKTIEEVEYLLEKFPVEWIRYGDELFSVDMIRTEELLDEMIARGIGKRVKWDAQTHVRYVNKSLLKKFYLAGVNQIDMGVESGDSEILKHLGKGTNIEVITNAFKIANEEGVKTGSLLLLGQPNETINSIKSTINLAVKINATLPMFSIMMPLPGTNVAKMAAMGEGNYKNLSTNWDEYRQRIGGAIEFAGVSRTVIERMLFWGYFKVFLLNYRFFDFLIFLWQYKSEGINLLIKIFQKKQDLSSLLEKPKDYETVLKSNYMITINDMINSKEQFDTIQRNELKRTNQLRPDLIKTQMPIKEDVSSL